MFYSVCLIIYLFIHFIYSNTYFKLKNISLCHFFRELFSNDEQGFPILGEIDLTSARESISPV